MELGPFGPISQPVHAMLQTRKHEQTHVMTLFYLPFYYYFLWEKKGSSHSIVTLRLQHARQTKEMVPMELLLLSVISVDDDGCPFFCAHIFSHCAREQDGWWGSDGQSC